MNTCLPARFIIALTCFCLVSVVSAAPGTYKIDPVHSSISFKVRHFLSSVTGKFTKFDGTFTVDPDAVPQATVASTVQVASIDTANTKRDEDLKSADFFDAAKFPEITFKSQSVKRTANTPQIFLATSPCMG